MSFEIKTRILKNDNYYFEKQKDYSFTEVLYGNQRYVILNKHCQINDDLELDFTGAVVINLYPILSRAGSITVKCERLINLSGLVSKGALVILANRDVMNFGLLSGDNLREKLPHLPRANMYFDSLRYLPHPKLFENGLKLLNIQ